jgi:uncharacterized phiE125 gp8 family phage protein
MDLIETSSVADTDLPVVAFRAHLRLGAGFADAATGDPLLTQYLRAAIAAIEARTGKVLLSHDFRMTVSRWRWPDAQALPVAPVSAVASVTLIDGDGNATVADAGRWRLIVDRHRPQIVATGAILPQVPTNGTAQVDFTAGFGATWDAVPDDLAQAVMLLAAQYYEGRMGVHQGLPGMVESLLTRWMPMRITAGGHK